MKVIGYLRVSTKGQELTRQRELVKKYCKENNHELIRIISEKASGGTNERDGYKEVMSLTSADCEILVVCEISRLSRSEDIISTLRDLCDLTKKGITIYSLDDKQTIEANKSFNLIEIITNAVKLYGAAEERAKIKERLLTGKKSMHSKAIRGTVSVPFGFTRIETETNTVDNLMPNADDIATVKEMYKRIMDGETVIMVTKWINSNKLYHKVDRGKIIEREITAGGVSSILRNELYKGNVIRFGGEVVHKIEPIVSEWVFNEVNRRITTNQLRKSKSKIPELTNPLKGIFKCGCGGGLGLKRGGRNGKPYFTCNRYIDYAKECDGGKSIGYYNFLKAIMTLFDEDTYVSYNIANATAQRDKKKARIEELKRFIAANKDKENELAVEIERLEKAEVKYIAAGNEDKANKMIEGQNERKKEVNKLKVENANYVKEIEQLTKELEAKVVTDSDKLNYIKLVTEEIKIYRLNDTANKWKYLEIKYKHSHTNGEFDFGAILDYGKTPIGLILYRRRHAYIAGGVVSIPTVNNKAIGKLLISDDEVLTVEDAIEKGYVKKIF